MAVIVDLNLACIICLRDDGGELVSVYSDSALTDVVGTAAKLTLVEKIALCSNLNLANINLKLSNQICTNCLEDLDAAWRFRRNCETSYSLYQSIQQEELEDVLSLANCESNPIKKSKLISPNKQAANANKSLTISALSLEDTKQENVSESDQGKPQDEEESLESYGMVEYVDEEDQKETDYYDCVKEGMLEEMNDDNFGCADKAGEHLKEEKNNSQHDSTGQIKQELCEDADDIENDFLMEQLSNDRSTGNDNEEEESEYVLGDYAQEDEANEKENSKSSMQFNYVKVSSNAKKSTNTKSYTRRAKSSHGSPKICEVCGNSYKYKHALVAHMKRHNNDRQFGCELCEKAFVSNVELRRHMRVHTGVKPYPCSFCERRFSDFGSRSKHERTHTGERPYTCPTCLKSFAYPHVLTVHLRTHTGEKKFQCTRCGRGFTKKAYLLTHMENHARCEGISLAIDGSTIQQQQQQAITAIKTVALEESIITTTTDIIDENDSSIADKLQNIVAVEQSDSDPYIIELEEAIVEEHLEEEANGNEFILGVGS